MGLDLGRIGVLNARRILTENSGIAIFRKTPLLDNNYDFGVSQNCST